MCVFCLRSNLVSGGDSAEPNYCSCASVVDYRCVCVLSAIELCRDKLLALCKFVDYKCVCVC